MKANLTMERDTDTAGWMAEVVRRERPGLRAWLRRHAPSAEDVDDILQDAFCEFVMAYRLTVPIQNAGAWLMQVAKNRLVDRFRKHRELSLDDPRTSAPGQAPAERDTDEARVLGDWAATSALGPEAAYARSVLARELEAAIEALPEQQRTVFIAHEIHGRSFRDLAATTGENLNTLLSRKRAAVQTLRRRLREAHDHLDS